MNLNIKHEIDTSGTCCPVPMISTIKVLSRLQTGDVIKVISTDHGFINDVQSLEQSNKCKIIEVCEGDVSDFAILSKI